MMSWCNKMCRFTFEVRGLVIFMLIYCTGIATGTISVVSQQTEEVVMMIDDTPALSMPERVRQYGVDGYVVYSTPPDACSPVLAPPRSSSDGLIDTFWILLAKHSPSTPNCSFQNKTEHALSAGYSGIIIHNTDSNSTEDMDEAYDSSESYIYASFIGEYDGSVLKENFSYPGDRSFSSFVRIRYDDSSSTNEWLVFIVTFLVILCFCALLVVPVLMCWNLMLNCFNDVRRAHRRRLRTAIIHKFPVTEWAYGDANQSCVICLDDFLPHVKVRILPCSHGFHIECIDPWLRKCKKFCPICRRKVIVSDENLEQQSESDDESSPLLRTATSINSASRGNTFTPQSENPFQKALRIAKEIRAAARESRNSPSFPPPAEQSTSSRNSNVGNTSSNDPSSSIPHCSTSSRENIANIPSSFNGPSMSSQMPILSESPNPSTNQATSEPGGLPDVSVISNNSRDSDKDERFSHIL